MKPVTIVTTPSLRAYGYRRLVAGILIGAALAYGLTLPARAIVDERMEKACHQRQALALVACEADQVDLFRH